MTDRDKKRAHFEEEKPRKNKWLLPLALGIVIAVAVAVWTLYGSGSSSLERQMVTAQPDGSIRFNSDIFADGKAQFYRYQGKNGQVDFFVVRSHDGVIRAAFDACDVCYKERKGYKQEGDDMVCINCGQRFSTDRINEVKGGCNPAPLRRLQHDDEVVIAAKDIEQGVGYFNTGIN